jgi:hypothetical protein
MPAQYKAGQRRASPFYRTAESIFLFPTTQPATGSARGKNSGTETAATRSYLDKIFAAVATFIDGMLDAFDAQP